MATFSNVNSHPCKHLKLLLKYSTKYFYFLCKYVENRNLSYYLYMTPPVEKLRGAMLRETFYDKGCVPKALFYLGTDD